MESESSSMPAFAYMDSARTTWTPSPFAAGVEFKRLGKANGRGMQLVRFAAGTTFPAHLHTGPEFIYMLEGEAIQNGRRLQAGYAGTAEKGTVDTGFRSDTGCVFLLVCDLNQVFDSVTPDGGQNKRRA
ncbi:cupin domain-containing protein [Paraburkholderia dipogonis]|uniref:Cupin domain-containing protein n=1 Tax=Paraburkholderia dipogonis TaxID=1211383 RepID=A0ABW9B365_9BURK